MFRQEKEFTFLQNTQTFSGTFPPFYSIGTGFHSEGNAVLAVTVFSSLVSPLVLWSHISYPEIDLTRSSLLIHLFLHTILLMSNSHAGI